MESKRGEAPLESTLSLSFEREGDTRGEVDENLNEIVRFIFPSRAIL